MFLGEIREYVHSKGIVIQQWDVLTLGIENVIGEVTSHLSE